MKSAKPTLSLFLDMRRQKIDGTFALKLVVYFAGKKDRLNLPFSFTKDDWNKLQLDKRLKDNSLKEAKRKINAELERANSIVDKMGQFSYMEFRRRFLSNAVIVSGNSLSLKSRYDQTIENLNNSGRVSTASSYLSSIKSLLTFRNHLNVSDITPEFLISYEKFMLKAGASYTTIGIYLRPLRKIYNDAIKEGIVDAKDYPFRTYTIPAGRKAKRSLMPAQLKAIFEYQPETKGEERAKDFWLFSYLSNGINMKDICSLRYGDISGEFLVYYRAKTINTTKGNLTPIKVPLTGLTKEIVTRWGQLDTSPSKTRIFPFVKANATPAEERTQVQSFTRCINRKLKTIAQKLNIDIPLSTYVARHSFATQLKRKGQNMELIGEMLGHASKRTTENYLGSFLDEDVSGVTNLLLSF